MDNPLIFFFWELNFKSLKLIINKWIFWKKINKMIKYPKIKRKNVERGTKIEIQKIRTGKREIIMKKRHEPVYGMRVCKLVWIPNRMGLSYLSALSSCLLSLYPPAYLSTYVNPQGVWRFEQKFYIELSPYFLIS